MLFSKDTLYTSEGFGPPENVTGALEEAKLLSQIKQSHNRQRNAVIFYGYGWVAFVLNTDCPELTNQTVTMFPHFLHQPSKFHCLLVLLTSLHHFVLSWVTQILQKFIFYKKRNDKLLSFSTRTTTLFFFFCDWLGFCLVLFLFFRKTQDPRALILNYQGICTIRSPWEKKKKVACLCYIQK